MMGVFIPLSSLPLLALANADLILAWESNLDVSRPGDVPRVFPTFYHASDTITISGTKKFS